MTTKPDNITEKDTILFVGNIRDGTVDAFKKYNKTASPKLKILLAVDQNKPKSAKQIKEHYKNSPVEIFNCNFRIRVKVKKALSPYVDRIAAVTAQAEDKIPELKKVIPHLPYIQTPTIESLDWATDKIIMRRLIDAHDPKLTPKFLIARSASLDVIERVGKRLGYPVIVKPAGLGGSKLVSKCYHEDELQHVLKKTFRSLLKAYREQNGRGEPQVIIEQAVEGIMYSVDGYVDSKGKVTLLPPVHVKTGKEIGFDDFFGYRQLVPTLLNKESVDGANNATISTIRALGLRSTTIHCELFKTEQGWKIIELGPRMGGYRHKLYDLTYDINHIMNDVLIRMGKTPIVPKKRLGHAVYMKFYAKDEGIITNLAGVAKVKKMDAVKEITIDKKVGDEALYAKHGHGPVVKLLLFNEERSGLLADIRRIEQTLVIDTKPTHVIRKQLQETADAFLHPIEDVELLSKKAAKKFKNRVAGVFEDTFDEDN